MGRRDEVLARHVEAWLTRAHRDLDAARADLAFETPLLGDVLFHCQQAAEKALKGLLTAHGVAFTKTRAIEELAVRVLALEPDMEALLRQASRLTVYAWRYRYPGDVTEPSDSEVREALEAARAVTAAVDAAVERWRDC